MKRRGKELKREREEVCKQVATDEKRRRRRRRREGKRKTGGVGNGGDKMKEKLQSTHSLKGRNTRTAG